jgi:ribosomal protein S17
MSRVSYSGIMTQSNAYMSIRLDLSDPIEIGDFASLFAGMGGQFESYLKQNHPEMSGSVRMYVREVRKGSVVADLFTQIPDLVGQMDNVLIITGFAALFSKRIRSWIAGNQVPGMTKPELKDANDTIVAIANAQKGTATITSYKSEKNIWAEKTEVTITVSEARQATQTIETQIKELDKVEAADYQRVLMVFTRSDVHDAQIGKGSGDRVIIEEISEKPLALLYGSELAQQEIKHEIREADENFFKKGFSVDVNVATRNGRPVAYSVTNLHQIVDLPEEESGHPEISNPT